MLNILLSTGAIAGIAAGGAVALIAICLLLYFLVFKHFRYKKQVDELERKFEYLHGLLTGQDARWMRQIEQIASSNLLFVSRHQTFEKRFKDLRDKGDASEFLLLGRDQNEKNDFCGSVCCRYFCSRTVSMGRICGIPPLMM